MAILFHLTILTLFFGGDLQTPEQYFNLAMKAKTEKDYLTAITNFNRTIGAVTKPEDIKYAVMSIRHLRKVYPKVRFASPWPRITKKDAKALIKNQGSEQPSKIDEEIIGAAYSEHPYFKALIATNLLIQEASKNPQLANQYLLMAFFLKKDYPIIFMALSHNAKRQGKYLMAERFLTEYQLRVRGQVLPELDQYRRELMALRGAPSLAESPPTKIDSNELRRRMKKEKTAPLYYEYAMTLKDPRANNQNNMVRYLAKAHKLDPENVAVLLAWSETVPDQEKKDHALLPKLTDLYRKNPHQADLMFHAVRLAARKKKEELARQLLINNPDFTGGYRYLHYLNPEEANQILKGSPWISQKKARTLVFSYLENRKDPQKALDLLSYLNQQYPDRLEILEQLLSYTEDLPVIDRERWENKYRDLLYTRFYESMADTDIFSAKRYLRVADERLEDRKIKVLYFILKEMTVTLKGKELKYYRDTFPESAYFHEKYGDWLMSKEKYAKAVAEYKRTREIDPKMTGIDEKINQAKDARSNRIAAGLLSPFIPTVQLGSTPFSLSFYYKPSVNKSDMDHYRRPAINRGLTHLGLDLEVLKPILTRYPIISDNPAVEVLGLIEPED